MKEFGILPTSEIIDLDLSIEQMRAIADGLVPPQTTGIIKIPIEKDSKEKRKVRVTIEMKRVFAPEFFEVTPEIKEISNCVEPAIVSMFNRINLFHTNLLLKSRWIILGYITGKKEIPIIIFHYESFNLTCYTQKIDSDPDFIGDLSKLFNTSPY